MARFVVEGGTPLHGEITPAGNKNEALPLIAASLLTDDPVTLHNLPRIRDVRNMLEIASALGASVEDLDPHTTRITAKDRRSDELPAALAREIRPSLLFAAPLLHRRKRARLGQPGGDIIGRRRADSHFLALGELGATLDMSAGGFTVTTTGLRGADVILDEPSVTATENALLAAAVAKGRTTLHNAASEPGAQAAGLARIPDGPYEYGDGVRDAGRGRCSYPRVDVRGPSVLRRHAHARDGCPYRARRPPSRRRDGAVEAPRCGGAESRYSRRDGAPRGGTLRQGHKRHKQRGADRSWVRRARHTAPRARRPDRTRRLTSFATHLECSRCQADFPVEQSRH